MIIYPAIDLRAGRCVRLQQGQADKETVFSDDPVAVARRWVSEGAEWLHIVNLDRAFGLGTGSMSAIESIVRAVDIPIQLGGGLRDLAAIESAFALGVTRVVLGTVAVTQPEIVAEAVARFGAERVAVGIDARDGQVAVRGWQERTPLTALALARRVQAAGVTTVVYTDIARDGMLSGPNLPALRQMIATGLRVIASGGISCLDDLRALAKIPGVDGAIVGMALYTGAIALREAVGVGDREISDQGGTTPDSLIP